MSIQPTIKFKHVSGRVTPDRIQVAKAWVLRQKDALDRHDAEEGVPGAVAPKVPSQVMIGLVVAALVLLVGWLMRGITPLSKKRSRPGTIFPEANPTRYIGL